MSVLLISTHSHNKEITINWNQRHQQIAPPSYRQSSDIYMGQSHSFFKPLIGNSCYEQTGLAQIGLIHPPLPPPPPFSHHQAIARRIKNRRIKEVTRMPQYSLSSFRYISRNRLNPSLYFFHYTVYSRNSRTYNTMNSCIRKIMFLVFMVNWLCKKILK